MIRSIHSSDYDTRQHAAGYSLDGLRDLKEHPRRRRLWARGTNSAAMKIYEGLIQGCVDDICNGFKARVGQTIDIAEWMTFFGYVAPCSLCQDSTHRSAVVLISWATWLSLRTWVS